MESSTWFSRAIASGSQNQRLDTRKAEGLEEIVSGRTEDAKCYYQTTKNVWPVLESSEKTNGSRIFHKDAIRSYS